MAEIISQDQAVLLSLVRKGRDAAVSSAELSDLRSQGLVEADAFRLTGAGARDLQKYQETVATEQLGAWLLFITAFGATVLALIWLVSQVKDPTVWGGMIPGAIIGTSIVIMIRTYRHL